MLLREKASRFVASTNITVNKGRILEFFYFEDTSGVLPTGGGASRVSASQCNQ